MSKMSETTMLAAVYHGPHDLRVEECPMPAIGPGEALLRVDQRQHLRHRPAHLAGRSPQVSRRARFASPATKSPVKSRNWATA